MPTSDAGGNANLSTVLKQQWGDALAMLTYDLKNSLGLLLGYAELLLDGESTRSAGEQEELLKKLRSRALSMQALLTHSLLDFFTIETGHQTWLKEPLVMNSVLRRVGWEYQAEAQRRHVSLELFLQEGLPYVEGDPVALERIFSNLLQNTLQFTPEDGRVTIRSIQHKSEVIVEITDMGRRLLAKEQPLLFEQFQPAEAAQDQEGTGLGLYIARVLVEKHGGRMQVASTPSHGIRFCVSFPIAASDRVTDESLSDKRADYA